MDLGGCLRGLETCPVSAFSDERRPEQFCPRILGLQYAPFPGISATKRVFSPIFFFNFQFAFFDFQFAISPISENP
jgi:hypothetical protein